MKRTLKPSKDEIKMTKKVQIKDRETYVVPSKREYTKEGYLKVRARLARPGIQKYYGMDLGLKDQPFKLFSIYRPPEVVFKQSVLDAFNGMDVTNGHPKSGINADNYKDLVAGVATSNAIREEDSDYIACDLQIKDRDLIHEIEAGKKEISLGYDSQITFGEGVTPDGEHYDGILVDIPHINHIAVVNRGRAGGARLYDSLGENTMKLKIGTVEVEMQDEIGSAVQKEYEKVQTQLNDAETKLSELEKQKAQSDAEVESLKAQLKDAESKILTPEQMSERLKAISDVKDQAKIVAGDKFVCDSMDEVEIKRAALSDALPTKDFKDASTEYLNAFFDAQVEFAKSAKKSHQAIADAIVHTDIKDGKDGDCNGYEKHKKEASEAWKKGLVKKDKDSK